MRDTCISVAYVSGRLRFDTFLIFNILLKMVSVMNELHCHKKVVTYLTKILKGLYNTITKSTIRSKTLRERECSTELLVLSKDVLKNFANFTGKDLCQVNCEPKSLIYPCSLHLHYKKDSCTQLFFSGFCRIFKNTFLLEHSWASTSDFIFDIFKSNKYMKVSFLLTVFYRKSKIKQKSRVALKLGNLRFALQ